MNKKIKTLLPFALYEELQNMDQLDPKEMKDFLLTLRRYCDSSGKDYGKICKELEIEEPTWSGKLNPRQIKALDKATEKRWSSDPISTWKINPETGLVDIDGRFNAPSSDDFRNGSLLGIKFGIADGDFIINALGLTSLEGCPEEVTGTFNASNNKIENLIDGPKKVGKSYNVSGNNKLVSLEGAPEEIGETFNVTDCTSLPSLEGGPKKAGAYECNSTVIRSLKGAPIEIKGEYVGFSANYCHSLSSLEGASILTPTNNRTARYSFNGCENIYTLEGLPLDTEYYVNLEKNGLKPVVLRRALEVAKKTKSWIVAYLSMFTDPDFIKTGKAPKDPIREKLAPANIKKEIEQNGERFVVGLKSIWNDFRVKKILREIEIPDDTKADADMLSALDDIGL